MKNRKQHSSLAELATRIQEMPTEFQSKVTGGTHSSTNKYYKTGINLEADDASTY